MVLPPSFAIRDMLAEHRDQSGHPLSETRVTRGGQPLLVDVNS
jgi:hypothetical protein